MPRHFRRKPKAGTNPRERQRGQEWSGVLLFSEASPLLSRRRAGMSVFWNLGGMLADIVPIGGTQLRENQRR
jgi:hypothetical protein